MIVTKIDTSSSKPAAAVSWSPPVIHDVPGALQEAELRLERARALLASNVDDLTTCVLWREGFPPEIRETSESIQMVFTIIDEKLNELHDLISAVSGHARRECQPAIARNIDAQRERKWLAAVDRLDAVKLVPVTEANDETIGEEASRALTAVIETRVTSPGQFREKLEIIRREDVFLNHGVIDAIFADLDALGWSSARQVEG